MSRQGLVQATSSEWIKFRTIRSTWLTYLITTLLCIGIGALVSLGRASRGGLIVDPTRVSLQGFVLAEISIGVIGVLIVSSEYATGSIRATLAATPRRWLVLLAKALVLFCTSLAVGEFCAFVSFYVGQAILSSKHVPTASLSGTNVLRSVVLAGIGLALLALFAMGIGLMIRHTAGAITVYVSLLFVVFLILLAFPANWQQDIGRFLPEILTESMRSPNAFGMGAFSAPTSTIVLAAYAVGALGVGGLMLQRRDA